MLKRYIVFAWLGNGIAQGWDDALCDAKERVLSFDSPKKAQRKALRTAAEYGELARWQVVDLHTGEIVFEN